MNWESCKAAAIEPSHVYYFVSEKILCFFFLAQMNQKEIFRKKANDISSTLPEGRRCTEMISYPAGTVDEVSACKEKALVEASVGLMY